MIPRRALLAGLGVNATILALGGCARSMAKNARPATSPFRAGVNLSLWTQYGYAQSGKVRDDQLRGLRHIGMDHVRLPVDPRAIGWNPDGRPGDPPFHLLAGLDAAVQAISAQDLRINLDFHPGAEAIDYLKNHLATAEPVLTSALTFLVNRYSSLGEDRICFELMNEPHRFCPPDTWNELQGRLIRTLRPRAGPCWLVANGGYDPISTLRTIDVYPDPRVLYAFHFYTPYVVTHQGATWEPSAARLMPFLDAVPYPSDRLDAVESHIKPGADVSYVAGELRKYKAEHWDGERIRRALTTFADWSAVNRAPVVCTEFGIMRPHIDAASRLRWLADVVGTLTALGIPWTVWDYCTENFGISRCGLDAHVIEPDVATALGLGTPEFARASEGDD